MSITGDWWSERAIDIPGDAAAVHELAPTTTLRVVKHELRTPINHIIGYSEMLLEDLASGSDAAARSAVQVVLDTGRQMLAVVNAEVGGVGDAESLVSAEMLVSLRLAVRSGIDRVLAQHLEETGPARSVTFSADIRKILAATRRLAEFAHTGRIPAS
jgi:signal transduction histidine kinase